MTDIIKLLPDSVANQIAAGEVIQRPASVLKELMENAIDAGATQIDVYLKDAGRTQIQVIDNGCGMSETDARLSFERHATSKIRESKDLFSLHTLGFRGEALASIAAIAEVQLRSKRIGDELGTLLEVAATRIIKQEPVHCNAGSVFTVQNLFYNVPARRKFLKSDNTELNHLLNEFKRIALVNENTAFTLTNNDTEIYRLPASNLRQRIINVFGKSMKQALLPLETETTLVKISGFITLPEYAKKSTAEQYFFANGRYIMHPYLRRAVLQAYEKLIPPDQQPGYFIYLEVPSETIDINIHPTKTEVKFEDDRAIYQFLHSTVKQSLGKFNAVPAIDFEVPPMLHIPVLRPDTQVQMPEINIDRSYNPFAKAPQSPLQQENFQNWEKLYEGFENEKSSQIFPDEDETPIDTASTNAFLQLKGKYIVTSVKSGLLLIDQKRAHERILFEQYRNQVKNGKSMSQQSLFPEQMELTPDETRLWTELKDDFANLGFDIRLSDNNQTLMHGHPAEIGNKNPVMTFRKLLDDYRYTEDDLFESRCEKLAALLAQESAIAYNDRLTNEEMTHLAEQLFVCPTPNYSPTGKPTVHTINMEDIERKF
ncbi:MAG: DNA mismatch repair endonuclease MutL [Bacteroidales bacterium]|jgi:DNA mismatch repair protein MutL|nr:DNA mismatch repair endonuclease MutL [Bacteroidales bacterium]